MILTICMSLSSLNNPTNFTTRLRNLESTSPYEVLQCTLFCWSHLILNILDLTVVR